MEKIFKNVLGGPRWRRHPSNELFLFRIMEKITGIIRVSQGCSVPTQDDQQFSVFHFHNDIILPEFIADAQRELRG